MNIIILAAGMGTRLRPYTNDKPKALVNVHGRPILDYQLDVFNTFEQANISLVTGYKRECFDNYKLRQFHNSEYDQTNMVFSLFKAIDVLQQEQPTLICYGDIIFNARIVKKLLVTPGDICISADLSWLQLWQDRMEDPLKDAESFKMNKDTDQILELGKPLKCVEDAEAQYMGLIKLSEHGLKSFINLYNSIPYSEAKSMYMTDFIQQLINRGNEVTASTHNEHWYEIDSTQDLEALSSQKLQDIIKS
ncbi:phosphocholine cytidylyltransferase family protein [Pseudoalteromonas sp. McH1-7]|uniref:phosphocholine cytidylyltransferase family protein n=1 Tax=unclassified Pseudoalteromonas TaxID=194690 RepID=UPI000FFE6EA8|nr:MULTISPECIES: phosphocholine cytidylyltransferase family protein [unclassified Pseudoalteromonas]NUZ09591.1 phosphocholine cytidylyltransferase family protein [Pseudoalteromonas sp. McH1-7]RXF07183.1 phosphocholine cytidylyltransferase family protein [Pseudoalteromonas sp. PS5]USD29619.1 phosphocholine cytidylyltransferase family protein [Pseudoalteromonas sp. SCSIO 43201]